MKLELSKPIISLFVALTIVSGFTVRAQTFQLKANNTSTLDVGASWVSGTAPNSTQMAVWDSTVSTAANCAVGQAAGVTWGGITISNPVAAVVDGTGHTLNIWSSGINLVGQSLTLSNSAVNVAAAQTWTTANGNVLTVQSPIVVSNNLTINGTLAFSNLTSVVNASTLWITNPATVIIEETNPITSAEFQIGGSSMVIQTNGMVILGVGVASDGTMEIGSDTTSGSYYLSGGTNTDNISGTVDGIGVGVSGSGAGRCYIPNVAGGTGIMNVSGTGYFYSHLLRLGSQGTGIMNVTNGTVTGGGNGAFAVGYLGVGTLNVYGGSVNALDGMAVGMATNGPSTVNLYGGSITVSGNSMAVPQGGGGQSIVNVNGGTLTLNNGLALPNGGTNNMLLGIISSGTVNLNGGTNIVTSVTAPGTNNGYYNLNGGVLEPVTGTTAFIAAANNLIVNVQTNGAVINTVGHTVTIPAALLSAPQTGTVDGGLTKLGSGTLTLTNFNTYNGGTTISAGTLALTNGGSIGYSTNITIGSGATFDVSSVNTALGSGQKLTASATGANTTGTLNTSPGNGLTLSSGGLAFTSYGGGATAPLTAAGSGSLALNSAPVTVTTSTALAAGTYTLIAKSGTATVTGTPGTLTVGGSSVVSGATPSLQVNSAQLQLFVPGITAASTLSGSLSSTYGTPANPVSVSVSGAGLTGNVTATAQSGYQVSLSSGSGYGSSVSLTENGGALSATTVYVEFTSAEIAGNYNNATAVVLTSSGAATINVATTSSGNTVGKATPTLSVGNSPVTYNGSPQAATVNGSVSGTVSSVLYSGSSTVPTTAGTYAITASFAPGDSTDYNSLSGASAGNFVINKATPTATLAVNNSPVTYNGSGQAATVGISASSMSGTVSSIFTGGAASQTAAGTYAVTASFVPTDNTDYSTLTGLSAGNFVINQASPSVVITSSENPSGYTNSITFSAALPGYATGSVTFQTNSVLFDTETLASGNATSIATTLLPIGNNTVTAQYVGDANDIGSTNSLVQVVTNYPPVAGVMTVYRTAGTTLKVALSDMATNWSDAQGSPVELMGVNLLTTNSQTLFLLNVSSNVDNSFIISSNSFVGYTNGPNVADQYSYNIVDGYGGTNIGLVNIVIVSNTTGQATGLINPGGSSVTVNFAGWPGYSYSVQRSTNLVSGSGWVTIWTTNAPANGLFNYTDSFSDLIGVPSTAYYRLSWQP